MTPPEKKPLTSPTLAFVAAGWFLIALFIGETRLLSILPGPAPQLTLWALTVLLLLCASSVASFRDWVSAIPLKALVAIHLTRFVGIYFLWLCKHGQLPSSFAIPAGWGDIAAATTAAGLLFVPGLENRKWLLAIWNLLALVDILTVVTSGIRIGPADRLMVMDLLTQLPLSFLPTMVVPLILATHLLIFLRIWNPAGTKNIEEPAPAPQAELARPA